MLYRSLKRVWGQWQMQLSHQLLVEQGMILVRELAANRQWQMQLSHQLWPSNAADISTLALFQP
jgi:hypothetical protein